MSRELSGTGTKIASADLAAGALSSHQGSRATFRGMLSGGSPVTSASQPLVGSEAIDVEGSAKVVVDLGPSGGASKPPTGKPNPKPLRPKGRSPVKGRNNFGLPHPSTLLSKPTIGSLSTSPRGSMSFNMMALNVAAVIALWAFYDWLQVPHRMDPFPGCFLLPSGCALRSWLFHNFIISILPFPCHKTVGCAGLPCAAAVWRFKAYQRHTPLASSVLPCRRCSLSRMATHMGTSPYLSCRWVICFQGQLGLKVGLPRRRWGGGSRRLSGAKPWIKVAVRRLK